ncbi:MAG: hypothetical protein L6R42_007697 [Xanthoria sp. 1 TBL-2021]|nr:MAG: hypothetical protein L6R42_007697 [Xanthoria sp. 1 TBL-2021]
MDPTEGSQLARKKRSKFEEALRVGTWDDFLKEDAAVSRKAFTNWLSRVYLPQGNPLRKDVKAQLHRLCQLNPNERATLLPGTIDILKLWEFVPLVEGTRQWAIARARLVGQLLANGTFQESRRKGLATTPREIAEAHCWLHKKSDGTVVMFEPIRQPWHHKDLHWIPEPADGGRNQTTAEAPTCDWHMEVETAEKDSENPEALRIFPQTLQRLIDPPITMVGTPIRQNTQNEIAENSRQLHNTAKQTYSESHQPGDESQNPILGCPNVPTVGVLTPTAHFQGGESSEDPMISSTRVVVRAEPVTKTEPNEAEDHTVAESSKTAHPTISTEPKRNLYRFTELPSGVSSLTEAGTMPDLSNEASEQAQELPLGTQNARQMNNEDDALLEVSEDESDDFNHLVKMKDIPWDYDSLHNPRFYQGVDARSEGNSSDLQIIERMTDNNSGGNGSGDQVGRARLNTPSLASSLTVGPRVQYTEDDYEDEDMETEEETAARFAMQGDPEPGQNAAFLFGRDLQSYNQCIGNIDTADSEATTEIMDRDDAAMAGSGGGFYDEQDKENRAATGTEDKLGNDANDRLEVRFVEDMYALSEEELAAERTTI